uniref:Lysosome-associated membrane glycoprotein 5 n=1 Tax=Arion vulgaris TaxID=1028688 RepID=A0A0B6Z7D3_9EUPU
MSLSIAMKAILLLYIQLIFITDQVMCQQTGANQENVDPASMSTDSIFSQFGQDEGSGEVQPTVSNTTDGNETNTLPHFVVKDASGNPCFLATLNATLQVSYRVAEGIVHEAYIALAEIQLPEDVKAKGICGQNTTRLFLEWGNGTFHINITFTINGQKTETENATWSLTDLSVSYDLSNHHVFPGTSETDVVTIQRDNLALFTTPVGYTHVCDQNMKVSVGPNERGVTVNFHEVKIAAFGVTSSEYPPDVKVCPENVEAADNDEILVPLIVACCLSAVVVIIVIAYVIKRKIQTTRDQTDYKQMP